MRELKFRVWVNNNYMANQGTPDLETFQSFMFHYCNEKLLMQFTGLKDKNGVDIYEGDILLDYEIDYETQEDISSAHPVIYDDKNCQFTIDNSFAKNKSSLVNIVEYLGIENLEVIGNIHENPELITQNS